MKGDELLGNFVSLQERMESRQEVLLRGNYSASCEPAVIIRNCMVQKYNEGGSSVRTVMSGTLVQVWVYHDDVRFSIACEETLQLDSDCLICKSTDVVRVSGTLWGALFPLNPKLRVEVAKNQSLASRLATIDIGSTVELLGPDNEYVAFATVVFKNEVPGLKLGVYYGVQLMDSQDILNQIANLISLLTKFDNGFPPDCDAIVSLQQLRPVGEKTKDIPKYRSSLALELNNGQIHVPKSVSYHMLRSTTEGIPRRRASKSVDLTCKPRNFDEESLNPELPGHINKTHSASRSLDLPPSSRRRLTRGRACTSLDSPLTKTADVNGVEAELIRISDLCQEFKNSQLPAAVNMVYSRDDAPLIPLTVLNTRWDDGENGADENFYDVPRDARHRKLSEVQSIQKTWHNTMPCVTHASNLTRSEDKDSDLCVGTLVEVMRRGYPHYGVIRWIGRLPDASSRRVAGVEMDEELDDHEDIDTRGLFSCAPYKALFVPLSHCRRDSRFQETASRRVAPSANSFGQIECPIVEGTIPPICVDLRTICGKNRGIQGHHNSCYLDATLFSMFAFTSVFDSLLYRPATKTDIPQYSEVQKVLRDEIVNPLRRSIYVRADRVMKLRTLLEQLSSVTGLTSEEKDPEEFLNSLLAQILKADPFLHLSSGQDAYHYQLFVEKDDRLSMPTVQQLLEQSFVASDIKLKQLPPCLIVQMPRFGKAFKMYPRILPSTLLDVTDVIDNSPRQCAICGKLAVLECRECCLADGLEAGSFCQGCCEQAHKHPIRFRHKPRVLDVPLEFRELQDHCAVPRLFMHLFAVVCIETSHYVSFLNTDQGWVFFDSMADRKGEQNGYNIPEMVPCDDLPFWLSEDGARALEEIKDEKQLPDLAKRLLCDAYMCMYQSSDIMMYQ